MALVIDNIRKEFGEFVAIDDVSFTVEEGRMFGFLGTNGAGKTTTMRMVLDILRPDGGSITWNGVSNREIPRQQFGYLPEERGLYPKMKVEEQLLFIAQLYGADRSMAKAELDRWLDQLNIEENRHKTIEQLSKGNQQKIQFLAAVLHDPDILILDEPFSGLDPVNVAQMEEAFSDMKARGKTIIFSTHQLSQAQRLCEDVAVIHRGRMLVTGDVDSVRRSINVNILRLGIAGDTEMSWLSSYPEVEIRQRFNDHIEMQIPDERIAQQILQDALQRGETVTLFEVTVPSLNDVFLTKVRQSGASAEDIARIEAGNTQGKVVA